MSDEQRPAGYYPQAVFAQELSLSGVGDTEGLPETAPFVLNWDWYPHDATVFDVILRAEMAASQARPERVVAIMIGRFERVGQPEPAFQTFAMLNAPALLFPYVREAFSSLTSRGLRGALVLPTMNIVQVMADMKMDASNGYASLRSRPELAAAFGLSLNRLQEGTQRSAVRVDAGVRAHLGRTSTASTASR